MSRSLESEGSPINRDQCAQAREGVTPGRKRSPLQDSAWGSERPGAGTGPACPPLLPARRLPKGTGAPFLREMACVFKNMIVPYLGWLSG